MEFLAWMAGGLGINVARLAIYSGIAVTLTAGAIGGAVALKDHYIGVGRQQAFDEIAAQNRETLGYVTDAISKVDACRSLGRQWNTVDGVCE
jgi:fructose-1-phosphate kinase PfkB-like protein